MAEEEETISCMRLVLTNILITAIIAITAITACAIFDI